MTESDALASFKKGQERAKKSFPYRLKRLREEKGVGVNEFARIVGFAPSYISRLESGSRSNPSMKFLDKLTECFGVNRLWLLYGQKPIMRLLGNLSIAGLDAATAKKLEELGRAEGKDSHDELLKVLRSVSSVLTPNQTVAIIQLLREKNPHGEFAEIATDLLKNLLVEKISAKSKNKSSK
jgi:transcriptional regulator with XRE-family HTH domain